MTNEYNEVFYETFAGWLDCAEKLSLLGSLPDPLFELCLSSLNPAVHSLLIKIRDVSKGLPSSDDHARAIKEAQRAVSN